MKIFSSKKRVAAIGVVTAATLVGGGMAFAYWTTTGTGTGTASTGTNTPFDVTIAPAANPGSLSLAPGNGLQNFMVTVTNPVGAGVQQLNDVTVSVAGKDIDGNPVPWTVDTCSKDDYRLVGALAGASLTLTGLPALPAEIQPGGSWTGPVSIEMVNRANVNQNDCKGAPVPLFAAAS